MNVLILVLSARREPWGSLMNCSIETWDSVDHPKTQTLYYCGKQGMPIPCTGKSKAFYSTTFTEDLEDVSSRTIEAFGEALKYDWDFLARPNSSCYVHKKNLVKFCETIPTTGSIYGVLSEWGMMWGGCHYIFSRDVVEKMVANKDKWNHKVMDDESITSLLNEIGYKLESKGWCASINLQPNGEHLCLTYNHGESFTFTDWEDVNKLEGHFLVRCKYDPDRTQDLMTFRKLHEHWR